MKTTYKNCSKPATPALLLLCGLLAGGQAQAQLQLEGKLSARIGLTTIMPSVDSGDLSAPSLGGTKIDVKDATQITGGISYAINDRFMLDLPLGLPFEHKIVGAGAIEGVGKIGTVKALPMTLVAQYRFGEASSALNPYVGLGATYARFFRARGTAALSGLTGGLPSKPTTLSMENAWGATAQIGALWKFDKRWGVDVALTYVRLKTTGRLSTGQTIQTRLDPAAISVAMDYRF